MTTQNDSPKGPERIYLDLGGGFGAAASYVGSAFSTKDEWTIEYVRPDLYTQSQRELEQAKQELAEVKRELGFYLNLSQYIENCHVEARQERDRYRDLLVSIRDDLKMRADMNQEEPGVVDLSDFLWNKIEDLLNLPTLKPSDAQQASESDDAGGRKLNEPVGEIRKVRLRSGFITKLNGEVEHTYSEYVLLEDHLKAMRARVPEGYVLVPREPTLSMISCGKMESHRHSPRALTDGEKFVCVYKAMLAAAPKPPGQR